MPLGKMNPSGEGRGVIPFNKEAVRSSVATFGRSMSTVSDVAIDAEPRSMSDTRLVSESRPDARVGPAEMLTDGQTVYNLYRGVICVCNDRMARIWVDLSHMEICLAKLDSSFIARYPLKDLSLKPVSFNDTTNTDDVDIDDGSQYKLEFPLNMKKTDPFAERIDQNIVVTVKPTEAYGVLLDDYMLEGSIFSGKNDSRRLDRWSRKPTSSSSSVVGKASDFIVRGTRSALKKRNKSSNPLDSINEENITSRETSFTRLEYDPGRFQELLSELSPKQTPSPKNKKLEGSKSYEALLGKEASMRGDALTKSSILKKEVFNPNETSNPKETLDADNSNVEITIRNSNDIVVSSADSPSLEAVNLTDISERSLTDKFAKIRPSAATKLKIQTDISCHLDTSALSTKASNSTTVLHSDSEHTFGEAATAVSSKELFPPPQSDSTGFVNEFTVKPSISSNWKSIPSDDEETSCSTAAQPNLHTFISNIRKLREVYDSDKGAIMHLQRNLFQYLWRFNAAAMSPEQLYSAQAVLAFNLDPKDGIKYLKEKVFTETVEPLQVGQWLAEMSAACKGGVDPSILGTFFSRKDTMDIYLGFVEALDFSNLTMIAAIRKLFDCFKPGGEGQVIDRIIKYFAESYYKQQTKFVTDRNSPDQFPRWRSGESCYSFGFAMIMLNTDLHVMSKLRKAKAQGQNPIYSGMSVRQFIQNTRTILTPLEASDTYLENVYEDIRACELQLRPLPQAPLSSLPVAPDIEGWLMCVLPSTNGSGLQIKRYWCVLAIQRFYIFSDRYHGLGLYPRLCIDVKNIRANSVASSEVFYDVLQQILESTRRNRSLCKCFEYFGGGRRQAVVSDEEDVPSFDVVSTTDSVSVARNSNITTNVARNSDTGIVTSQQILQHMNSNRSMSPCSSSLTSTKKKDNNNNNKAKQQLVQTVGEYRRLETENSMLRRDRALVLKNISPTSELDLYFRQTPGEESREKSQAFASNITSNISSNISSVLAKSSGSSDNSWQLRKPRQKLFLCMAETPDLMNKWLATLSG